jgi:hypothetical protein
MNGMQELIRWLSLALTCIVLVGGGRYAVVSLNRGEQAPAATGSRTAWAPGEPVSEIHLVWIVSSGCRYCADPDLPELLRSAIGAVGRASVERDSPLRTIGIGVDEDPSTGLQALSRFGEFNEIVIGGGWMNLGAREFIWVTHQGVAAVPQLVVLNSQAEMLGARLSFNSDVLMRLVGQDDLKRWERQGFRLPVGGRTQDGS